MKQLDAWRKAVNNGRTEDPKPYPVKSTAWRQAKRAGHEYIVLVCYGQCAD